MSDIEEKKRFMVRQWEDWKKSGGVTFSLNQMELILQGGDGNCVDARRSNEKGYRLF